MSRSEADLPKACTGCSSLEMQQSTSNLDLEKDKEKPREAQHLPVKTEEPTCDLENSDSDNASWKLPAVDLPIQVGRMESPSPEPQHPRTYPQSTLEARETSSSLTGRPQGRISTSPTLRRLRSSVWGTSRSQRQQNALEVPTCGTRRDHGSLPCLSNSLPGSPKDSSHFLSPFRSHTRLPSNPGASINSTDTVWTQADPTDEDALPVLQPIREASLDQASSSGPEGSTMPSPELQHLGSQNPKNKMAFLQESSVPKQEILEQSLSTQGNCYKISSSQDSYAPQESKDRHKHISDMEGCLSSVRIADFTGYEFDSLKDKTWSEAMETHQKLPTDELLRKQQEAVWELFTSECSYFLDHLLVLKMVFMNTLKYLQIHDYLLDVDLWRLFANLEELTQTSLGFVNSLHDIIKDYVNASGTPPLKNFLSVLIKYFRGTFCRSHQTYCLNYSAAVFYLENLRQRDDFRIYLKWCEQNEHCRRLHLPDLLVAPLHRLTRYPLLLKSIWKRSTDSTEKIMIYSIKEKVEKSIRDLEGKVKWLDNFQKFRHLQEIIVWPPLWDRDKRFFIPEGLKYIFKEHMTENVLSPSNRHLLYEGKLTLAESTRFLDAYLFLFDDFLLITKTKRNKKKLGGSDTGLMCPSLTPELQTLIKEGGSCTVLDQPIPLDRLIVKSVDPLHVSVLGLRNAFLIQHENQYRQCIAAFLLQAQTENIKKMWIAQITSAISGFMKSQETKKVSSFTPPSESSEI